MRNTCDVPTCDVLTYCVRVRAGGESCFFERGLCPIGSHPPRDRLQGGS